MRLWDLPIALDRESELPLYVQISRTIAAAIQQHRLHPGDALPASRTLADAVGVHRNTVLAAHTELAAEGWVTSETSRGTFVSHDLPPSPQRRGGPAVLRPQSPVEIEKEPPLPFDRPPAYRSGTLVLSEVRRTSGCCPPSHWPGPIAGCWPATTGHC